MVIVLAATTTALLFLRGQATQARSDQFTQHALAQTRLVAEYAVSPLVFDDNKGARELLAKLALDPSVMYVRLDDAQGKVFAEVSASGTPVIVPQLAGDAATRIENEVLHVSTAVRHQGLLGNLHVGFRLTEL